MADLRAPEPHNFKLVESGWSSSITRQLLASPGQPFPCVKPHLAKHSADPVAAPVPTSGMLPLSSTNLARSGLCPNAAATISNGSLKRPFATLCVPASSELSAEINVAFSQPEVSRTVSNHALPDGEHHSTQHVPIFCMVCKLPRGKSVIFPGLSVVLTTRAPFSMTMNVCVSPMVATT
jgi:hypothetical protein